MGRLMVALSRKGMEYQLFYYAIRKQLLLVSKSNQRTRKLT